MLISYQYEIYILIMPLTPQAESFPIRFIKDDTEHEATVTYVKSDACCTNLFNVEVSKPAKAPAFLLREKPGTDRDTDEVIWTDDLGTRNMLYQLIGNEIEKFLKNDLGVFFIDAPLSNRTYNNLNPDY